MDNHNISMDQICRLSNIVADHVGLNIPESRLHNLYQGILAYHKESDFQNENETVEDLLSSATGPKIEKLAKYLTIGETYFFRNQSFYNTLEKFIIPQLIDLKLSKNQSIKIWSAGCSTGEEPYSVAMLLDKLIPNLTHGHIQILASDINTEYLKKLKEGSYSSWSFRSKALEYQKKYFNPTPDGRFKINDRIRNRVSPFQLNLIRNVYPSVQYPTGNSNIIFCRNVLMYFTPEKAQEVIQRFYHSLADDGWLVVSSIETSQELFPGFKTIRFPGVIMYQKQAIHRKPTSIWSFSELKFPTRLNPTEELSSGKGNISEPSESSTANANLLNSENQFKEANRQPDSSSNFNESTEFSASSGRAYANKGELQKAQNLCKKAISKDVLNPALHYLMGTILEEQKHFKSALDVMKQAIYLDRNFILAHIMAGNISLRLGLESDAHKYYRNALKLLLKCKPETVLNEAEGITVNQLIDVIHYKTDPQS